MIEFFHSFSNREVSIVAWTALVVLSLFFANLSAAANVLKSFFAKNLLIIYVLLAIYFWIIIRFLKSVDLWQVSLYKDLIFWLLTTGGLLLFQFSKLKTGKDFRNILLQIFSFNILVEFIAGSYNFSLIVELILIPIVTFISLLSIVAESKSEHKIVSKVFKWLLAIIGFILLFYVVAQLIIAPNQLFTVDNLKSFLFAPIFTLLFLPALWCIVAYSKYEYIFGNIDRSQFIGSKRKRVIKLAILRHANLNLRYLENAHNLTIWRKFELKKKKKISKYIKKAIKHEVKFLG